MATSLTLSYYGYQASDIQLFDGTEPFEVPIEGEAPAETDAGGLEEIPTADDEATGGLVEIPSNLDGVDPEAPAADQ